MNENMPILDNEPDKPSHETEAAPTGWSRPLLLAALGLVLMLGGYAVMNYVPSRSLTPRQTEEERRLTELREMAARQHGERRDVAALEERLKQVGRTPPYRMPGQLAIYGGLFLFLAAGFLMYRKTPVPKRDADEVE